VSIKMDWSLVFRVFNNFFPNRWIAIEQERVMERLEGRGGPSQNPAFWWILRVFNRLFEGDFLWHALLFYINHNSWQQV
jgi:hypothetical protein